MKIESKHYVSRKRVFWESFSFLVGSLEINNLLGNFSDNESYLDILWFNLVRTIRE